MAEARLLQQALDASGKGPAMASPGGDTHTSGHWRERMSKESFATSGAYALSHRDPHTMQRLIQTAPPARRGAAAGGRREVALNSEQLVGVEHAPALRGDTARHCTGKLGE